MIKDAHVFNGQKYFVVYLQILITVKVRNDIYQDVSQLSTLFLVKGN